jgi:microsomal dipeptidase-like Zn-dependent dipeptidase
MSSSRSSEAVERHAAGGLPAITHALVRRGYTDETILKVLGGNLLRVFEEV